MTTDRKAAFWNAAREGQFRALVADGLATIQIADRMGTSAGTIMRKFRSTGVRSAAAIERDATTRRRLETMRAKRAHEMPEAVPPLPEADKADPVQHPPSSDRPEVSICEGLARLADFLVEDILAASDEEILAEVAEDADASRSGVTILQLTNHTCRWPLWGHGESPKTHQAFYCGAVSNYELGEPYCPVHTKLMGAPPRQRPDYLRRITVTAQGIR